MSINPLQKNIWFKTERHNSLNPLCNIYEKGVEQAINIYGTTLFYYPVSEYSLDSISGLWGEDINKKYLEKFTLKGMTEDENDNFTFNQYGVDKTTAERVVLLSKKQFTEITDNDEPLESDMFLWTQNNIIYEIISVEDQEGIVLGKEMYWKITGTPRMAEGEIFGHDECDSTKETVVDPDSDACPYDLPEGDGDIVSDPTVIVPEPSPHIDDEEIIDRDKDGLLIRSAWGNW
jgi:hypothetical protein